jgi:hypothetical protein
MTSSLTEMQASAAALAASSSPALIADSVFGQPANALVEAKSHTSAASHWVFNVELLGPTSVASSKRRQGIKKAQMREARALVEFIRSS